ncbi:hypothetical protein J6590_027250 [Homalodisca vitripennis]|nr:hypothetical protein J6590_027250 [Homalodisca vitripennis]
MPNEGLVVSETRVDQTVVNTEIVKKEEIRATLSMLLHEAKTISETQTSQKTGDFEELKKPLQVVASPGLTLQEGINVMEVTQSVKEEKLEDFVVQSLVKPKVDILQRESVIVSEVLAETKPSKYVPELFVPTESATSTIVAQRNTAFTEEINLSEKEGEYLPGRLPQGQFAGLHILPEESILVSETNIHEKEISFGPGQRPGETVATTGLNVLEGLMVSVVQHQDTEGTLEVTKPETKKVDIQFTKRESFFTEETNIAESEVTFRANEIPGAKTASPSIVCLEIPRVSETITGEVTEEYSPLSKPTGIVADLSIQPIEPISITEIKPEDAPAEFSEGIKYRTDAASTNFQTLESKEIIEVQAQDSEKPMSDFDIPTSVSINKTYISKEGISVYQTEMIEKEGEYAPFSIPEVHTGKAVTSQPMQSIIVQEITPSSDVESISNVQPHSAQAKLQHTTFQETIVEETVIGEALARQKEGLKTEGKTASVNVLEEQSVVVTEVITDYKEDQYTKPQLPQECFASQSHLPQRVAVKSEVLPEQTISPLQQKTPTASVAKTEQLSFESLVISSIETAESESEFKKETFPVTSKANIELADQFSGLSIQEIISNEKELEHIPLEKPIESKASKSITLHHTALQSQTLPEINLGNIPKVEHPTGRAKVDSTPFQEVIVTETNITEIETSLNTFKPELKTASIGIRSGESFLVSEVVAEDKEDVFKSAQLPQSRKATLNLSGQEVAEHEEVMELIQEGSWARESPVKEQAQMKQDTIQLAVASQLVPSEMEGQFEASFKPSEKVAAVSFVEGNVLSVTEMNVVDKEIPLENATAPKTAIAVPDISGQDVAVTSEVVVDINVGDVNVLKLDLSEAKVKQSTHESVILRETTVGESEGEYIADLLPETKKAKPNIVEGHSTSVSSVVIIQDKESILLTPDKPKERLATPNITSQEIAEKTEIILGSSLELLKHETPTSAQATAEQLPYHSIIQSETSSNELEGPIQLPIKPESKIADISFEGIQAVSVYEVSTQDGTSQLAPESKPEDHFASAGILSRQVAQSTVIVPESSVGTINLQTPAKVLASLEQIPFESILTSVVSTSEKESSFEKQLKLDFNRAEKAFEEEKSIFISEVTVEDKEGELAQFTRPKEVTALADISAQEVAEMSEVLTEYSVGEIPTFDKPAVKAQEEQLPFESIIQIETSVQESEGVYKSREAPLSSVADIGVVEEKGVIITEVTLEDKEDQYTSPLLPETRKAEPSFIPIELYQKAEVVAEDSFGEITVTAPEKTFAKSLQSTLHSVVLKQTTVGESEAPLEEFIKPFSKTAEANFESAKSGITVNEITVQEKESDLIGPIKPSESRAEKSLLTREIACKSEVTVESSVKEFEQERPSKVTASVNQTPLQSIVQLEVSLIESESEYQGLTKPETKTAGISFEEGQGVSIVEVVVGDLENTFLPGETPGAKSATVNVCGREVAVKTEVLTESSVSETPKEEFQPIKPVNVQQIPFESVITTKPIVNEKESVLYEFKSDAQMANIAFVEGKGISITQVLTEDKESQLQLPEIPKKQTATSDVLAHNIVEQSEVQSEYSLSEITKFDTKLVEATSEHTPLESIVTTIPTVVESEQVFQKHFKPETKVAHSVLEEKQSVNVILTTAGDKETQFTEVEKPKERIASPRVSELEVAEHTEQTLHQTVGEFEHQKPILSKASSQHTTFESVIQTETIVRESEGKFDTNFKPDKRKASMSYEVGQSVTISEITLGEAESDYIGQLKPKDNKAKMVLSDVQEVAKQSQIIPEDSVGALVENIMVKESAVSEQATHQSLTVLENLVEEKETEFSVLCKPDTKRAGVAIEKSLKVQATTEVIPEYKEGGLAPLDLPEERRATPDIVSREVAEVSETLSQISIGDVVSTKTKTTTAIRTQTPFTTSIQEQVIVQESEEQFVHTIAQTRRASLVFEEGKGVVITEITAEDNEMPYMCDIPKPQTAHPEISVKEVVETFEISPEMQPSEIIVEFPDEIVANVDQTHLTSLLQSEVDVRESEVEFKSVIFEKKTAEYTFEEAKGVSVTIVTSEDKEDSLKPLEKPALKQAVPGVISKESLQTSEVQAEQTVGELKHHKPKEAKAKKEHPVSESVIVIQNIPQEQEETMEGKPGAPTAKAQIDFTLMREVAEKSEVITGIHPKKLETTKPAESFAKAETIVMEGIIQSEVSVNELEEELIKPDLPAKRRASVIKDVQEGIKVAQTVVADKEGIHETQPLPKQVKPSSLISEQETIVQTEVLVSSSTSTLKKDKMPEAVKIKPGQIPFESLETSITTVQEQEENIEVSWKPAISKGVKSVQESQSISVTEIVTEEKLHSDITQEKIPKEVAETKFIDQEVAVKSEVIAQLPVTPFDVSVPTPTVAKQSTPTQHHLIVTTHDTGEVEDSLSAVVTPAAKNIPIDVEEHKTTLLVTHVHPEEVPGKLLHILVFLFK